MSASRQTSKGKLSPREGTLTRQVGCRLIKMEKTSVNIRDELKQFVVENFLSGQYGDLGDDDSLFERGIIDSSGVLDLVAFIEERFAIQVRDSDLSAENFDSIQTLTTFIDRQASTTREVSPVGKVD
jgi:acyl carrier protein